MLAVICAASACDELAAGMKEKTSLLMTALGILKSMHSLGKLGQNLFTPAQRLDDFSQAEQVESELGSNPTFGFKRDLVRLIGNLCHQSRRNQDLVREIEGIPLILDVCNLDAKNPYIIQCVILAIRNLLENNVENQEVVKSLVQQGVITESTLLSEMGIKVTDTKNPT